MKLRIEQNVLDDGLKKVKGAINTGSGVIPIVTGFKLEAKEDNLTVRGTDLELEIETDIPAIIEEEGETVIPGNELAKLVKELPDDEITLEVKDRQARISYGDSDFSLKTYDADEFPESMTIEETGINFTIEPDNLEDMLTKTNFSCATDDTQPALNGVLFDISREEIVAVSTNTYRLSCYRLPVELDLEETYRAIIPQNSTKQIKKLAKDSEDLVSVSLYENRGAIFTFDNQVLKTRVIEGNFPNYNQVIPDSYNTELQLNTDEFKKGLRRVKIIAEQSSGVITINLNKDEDNISIEATDTETGEAHEYMEADIMGEEVSIRVDINYLMDVVAKAVEEDIATLKLVSELNPMCVEEENYQHLIMPIRKE